VTYTIAFLSDWKSTRQRKSVPTQHRGHVVPISQLVGNDFERETSWLVRWKVVQRGAH